MQVLLLCICVEVCECVGCPILSGETTSRNCVFPETPLYAYIGHQESIEVGFPSREKE